MQQDIYIYIFCNTLKREKDALSRFFKAAPMAASYLSLTCHIK